MSFVLVALIAGGVTIALARSGNTSAPITKARATAYAHAVNLRGGDVRGLIATGGSDVGEGPLGSLGDGCDGATIPAGNVVGVGSQTFERLRESTSISKSYLPPEGVWSAVYVMRSAALASREIAAVEAAPDSTAVVMCLKRNLEHARLQVTNEAGAKLGGPIGSPVFSRVEVSALHSHLRVLQADGLRTRACFAIKAHGAKGRSQLYHDFLGFAVGPAVVMLNATGDPHPFPVTTEHRLLSLLYSRAKAHKL